MISRIKPELNPVTEQFVYECAVTAPPIRGQETTAIQRSMIKILSGLQESHNEFTNH